VIHISCVSDFGFLAKGLALYESIGRFDSDFTLHYLCLDDSSFDIIKELDGNIIAYSLSDLRSQDKTLNNLAKQDYKYLCWSLASYFTNYLMNTINEDITYIDSDVFFHDSIYTVLNEVGDKDVGLFRHRQYPLSYPNSNGWFNVGVVHFKNSDLGKKLLSWWADAVLHKKYPELATCGDQRYLDAFVEFSSNLFIDGNIGHAAPWHWQLYDYSSYFEDGCILWNNQKQKLIFSHFSNFDYNLSENKYVPALRHSPYTPQRMYVDIPELKFIHDDYFDHLKCIHIKYLLGN
jgi:hypothetical protein